MPQDIQFTEEVTAALGRAVVDCWSELPQEMQQMLFERAAGPPRNDGFRPALALYLHKHHPRTAADGRL